MQAAPTPCAIRAAHPDEQATLGRLLVDAYAALPGMPGPADQPDYYAMLRDVARRAANPAIEVLAAIDAAGEPVGTVDFIADMRAYGAVGPAAAVPDAAGIRLLAVRPDRRGLGLGKALTLDCIARARALGRAAVVLHTTHAMAVAWAMYQRLGFARAPALDFRQGDLAVFGFRLELARGGARRSG